MRSSGARALSLHGRSSSFPRAAAGHGDDILFGRAGDDRLYGGPGADRISGGAGWDAIYSREAVADLIHCGSGRDTVRADPFDLVARDCELVERE